MSTQPELPPVGFQAPSYSGPTKQEVLADRESCLAPHLTTMFAEPLMLVAGRGQYVFEESGRRYLDAFGGVVTTLVGHANPRVMEAIQNQASKISHTSMHYLNPAVTGYAKALVGKFPDPLDTIVFVNSGSEANDLAILMARLFTGNWDVIGLRNAYHGTTSSVTPLIASSSWRFPVGGDHGISRAGTPYAYRGQWPASDPLAGERYAKAIRDHIEESTCGQIAAFFAESVQGVGGVVVPPRGFLSSAAGHARAAQGLYIADEVQSGFGRTGEGWWGFELDGVVPDVVTLSKGIGNGFPLAAVVTRREIAETLGVRLTYNTYGGSPLACAVGHAVLREIEEGGLIENARERGSQLISALKELGNKFPCIGDVRGSGLMVGIEFVSDRNTKEPAPEIVRHVLERARAIGCLFGKAGFAGNVLRMTPPLCVTEADVDFMISCVEAALFDLPEELG